MVELNKKLAEWSGWQRFGGYWRDTEDNFQIGDTFTNSLDACFKWLVPKLPANLQVSVEKDIDRPTFYSRIRGFYLDSQQFIGWSDESPALALCLAIEKLIDGESLKATTI